MVDWIIRADSRNAHLRQKEDDSQETLYLHTSTIFSSSSVRYFRRMGLHAMENRTCTLTFVRRLRPNRAPKANSSTSATLTGVLNMKPESHEYDGHRIEFRERDGNRELLIDKEQVGTANCPMASTFFTILRSPGAMPH